MSDEDLSADPTFLTNDVKVISTQGPGRQDVNLLNSVPRGRPTYRMNSSLFSGPTYGRPSHLFGYAKDVVFFFLAYFSL